MAFERYFVQCVFENPFGQKSCPKLSVDVRNSRSRRPFRFFSPSVLFELVFFWRLCLITQFRSYFLYFFVYPAFVGLIQVYLRDKEEGSDFAMSYILEGLYICTFMLWKAKREGLVEWCSHYRQKRQQVTHTSCSYYSHCYDA